MKKCHVVKLYRQQYKDRNLHKHNVGHKRSAISCKHGHTMSFTISAIKVTDNNSTVWVKPDNDNYTYIFIKRFHSHCSSFSLIVFHSY